VLRSAALLLDATGTDSSASDGTSGGAAPPLCTDTTEQQHSRPRAAARAAFALEIHPRGSEFSNGEPPHSRRTRCGAAKAQPCRPAALAPIPPRIARAARRLAARHPPATATAAPIARRAARERNRSVLRVRANGPCAARTASARARRAQVRVVARRPPAPRAATSAGDGHSRSSRQPLRWLRAPGQLEATVSLT